MIPEIGNFSLVLAFVLSILTWTMPFFKIYFSAEQQCRSISQISIAQAGFIFLAFACLTYSFVSNDFSVLYVAENSSRQLPLYYRFTASWGAHEGSILLWITILSVWTLAVIRYAHSLPKDFLSKVLSVLGFVSCGFLAFIIFTSNPFARLLPNFPANGQDLNPLLQDPGFIFHPPMLYMGYVGLSVAFAFAIAALLTGEIRKEWVKWTRPWTLIAWSFLTFGITLGSWWAYRELGWGGWWFWDPVENASFLPWLIATALIHSLAVTEKRNAFHAWTLLLAITAFSLSLLGTFLVRSGVLTSVHAFAVDPTRGVFILAYLTVVIGGSLILYGWRAPDLKKQADFSLLSRETFLLMNNLFLTVAMSTVLLGTLYPLIAQVLNLGKISVGAPYFNTVFVPLFLPMMFLMGIAPLCRWQNMSFKQLLFKLRYMFVLVLALSSSLFLLQLKISATVVFGVCLALWVISSCISDLIVKLRTQGESNQKLSSSYYGMLLAHTGIAVCVIGITLVTNFQIERNVKIAPGETVAINDYQFTFKDSQEITGPNYHGIKATFLLSKHGRQIETLFPEKRIFDIQNMPMSHAAIDMTPFRDLYIALGEPIGDKAWSVRVYYKPFIRWIWFGGLLILFGGILAVSDRRYRNQKRQGV